MTMNARLSRYLAPDDLGAIFEADPIYTGSIKGSGWENPRDGYVINLDVFHPQSVKGRTVLLRLTEKDRDDLLVLLRGEAVRARS